MNRYTVTLTEDERKSLHELTSKGKHNSQQILNALILLRDGQNIISSISVSNIVFDGYLRN